MVACGMAKPLFKIGDLVKMVRAVGSASHRAEPFFEAVGSVIPGGIFEVMTVLPERESEPQFWIRGGDPAHLRVVSEAQITHTSVPQPRR